MFCGCWATGYTTTLTQHLGCSYGWVWGSGFRVQGDALRVSKLSEVFVPTGVDSVQDYNLG